MRRRAGPRIVRALWAGTLTVLVALLCCACQARTEVAVTANPNGSGVVAVTVTLDRAANAAIGGLAGQLDTAGLAAQGWTVDPVTPAPGGGASVTASRPFSTPAQMSAILASVAGGTGSGGAHVFQLDLTRTHSLWRDRTTVAGRVDLSCGVSCFGDRALESQTGSPLGFDIAKAAAQAGESPAQVLSFQLQIHLPGTVASTDAASRAGGVLVWQPLLGQQMSLDASTWSWKTGSITTAAIIGAVLLVLLAVAAVLLWRRRRRRRRSKRRPSFTHSRSGAAARR